MWKRGRPAGLTKEIPNTHLEKQGVLGPSDPWPGVEAAPSTKLSP